MSRRSEVDAASGDGVPGLPGPPGSGSDLPLLWHRPLQPCGEAFPDTPSAEPEALARKQRLVLDKAYRHLLDQGFGVLELASLDLDEVPAMARQLPAAELANYSLGGLARGRVLLAARRAGG